VGAILRIGVEGVEPLAMRSRSGENAKLTKTALRRFDAGPGHGDTRARPAWTGAASTDWFIAGNWTAGDPTSSVATTIDTNSPNATVVGAAGAQANTLYVGIASGHSGTLTIQNGGTLINGGLGGIVGFNNGSTGSVTVDGVGSTWSTGRAMGPASPDRGD
jgi:hypothetical protein